LLIAFDTASEMAGIALMENGLLLGELTWRTRQSHSRELLPALDWLLQHQSRSKEDIAAIAVCTGPGSYAGLRVGISTAKALAFGLEVPLVGIGRLAAEAYAPAMASAGRVIAVQAAGRGELAWAIYRAEQGILRELAPPRLGDLEGTDGLAAALQADDAICGDLDRIEPASLSVLEMLGARPARAISARVLAVAELGRLRCAAGDVDDADSLVPLYLRAPAIGPQPPR
jgi:tRNA threonylcarbamoyladenosine biosynthesis protein TsaB